MDLSEPIARILQVIEENKDDVQPSYDTHNCELSMDGPIYSLFVYTKQEEEPTVEQLAKIERIFHTCKSVTYVPANGDDPPFWDIDYRRPEGD